MSDLSKKITELLSDSCKAAPDMTHGLKNIGDGDMKEGMKTIAEFFEESGMKKGELIGTVLGTAGTLSIIGLIVGVKKLYSMKISHKEKGEKILNGLTQGIANESTESIKDYDSAKESKETGNIRVDNA